MIIGNSRQTLDSALGDKFTTLFVLCGPRGSEAFDVHELIEAKVWDPHQRWFLLTDLSVLKPHEDWFGTATSDRYAVLHNGPDPKAVATDGPTSVLLNADGKPGFMKIRREFLKGDM